MNIGFQHVTVSLGSDRFGVFFFFEHAPARLRDQAVNLGKQRLVEVANIVGERFVMKGLLVRCGDRGHSEDLPQQRIVIGQIFQAVIVTIQSQAHDPQHENLPEAQSGTPGRLFAAANFRFEQGKNPGVDLGRLEDPLQAREDGWQFVTTFEGDPNAFNGSLSQGQLHIKTPAHGL